MSHSAEYLPAMPQRALDALIQRLPEAFRGHKPAFMFVYMLFLTISGICYALIGPYPQAAVSNLTASMMMAILLVLASFGLPLTMTINLASAYGAAHLFYNALCTGGIYSPVMAWFAMLPLAPLYVQGRRVAFCWLVIALMACVGIAWLTWSGRLPVKFEYGPHTAVWSVVNYLNVALNLLALPMLYDILHERVVLQVQQRNRELAAARDALVKAQLRKDEFIATVSHELRTPMNAILGFNDLLRTELAHLPRAQEIVEHVRHSADHLLTVINDVLDYSQLQAGRLKIQNEPFPLRQTVNNAFCLFEPRVDRMAVNYSCQMSDSLPEWIVGDRHRLMQILVNLLGNALKFTQRGRVELCVSRADDWLLFEVRDTGIGIPPDRLGSVFGKFEQVSADTHRHYGGHGLGLSISERLVKLQGGEIGVESIVGKGSHFWFRLPCIVAEPPETATQVQTQLRLTSLPVRMLIVDDNPVNRMVARQVLQKMWPNAVFDEAQDGRVALQKLRDATFDIVLMDMVMPEMDGIEATRLLRTEFPEPMRSIPVLALTANVNPADRDRCLAVGMNDIVLKPFDRQHLSARIEALLLSSPTTLFEV